MSTIQFVATSPNDLKAEITADIKTVLDNFLENYKPIQPKEYLSRKNVADMFGVDLSTVHNWCKAKKLNPLAISGRIYFLRSEVEESLKPLNV